MGSRFLVIFLFFLTSHFVFAGSCCGSSSYLPSLITGDYKAQFVISGSNSAITHDSDNGELTARDSSNQRVTEVLSLSMSYQTTQYTQIGLTLPYKLNTYRTSTNNEQSKGIADIKAFAAFEFLPELTYSALKPRGFLFMEQTFANSTSTYDAQKPLNTDSLGSGFYTTTLGLSFIKSFYNFNLLFMTEVHKSHRKSFRENGSSFSIDPKLSGSAQVSVGYTTPIENLSISSSLLYSREGAREITGDIQSLSSSKYLWQVGLSANYKYDDLGFSLGYTDQSYLNKASNTVLSKSISTSITKYYDL